MPGIYHCFLALVAVYSNVTQLGFVLSSEVNHMDAEAWAMMAWVGQMKVCKLANFYSFLAPTSNSLSKFRRRWQQTSVGVYQN